MSQTSGWGCLGVALLAASALVVVVMLVALVVLIQAVTR